MALSRQDLIALVLQNVGVLAAGQEASLEDRAAVDLRIDRKLAELAKREIIAGLDADALDDGVALYVADILAYACRFAFGINGAKAEGLAAANADAEGALKELSRQYSTTAATAAFDIVRHALETLGVVTAGQDPSAQDRGVVTARVAPMLADLKAREIIAFTALTAADPAHLPHLATILTAAVAPAFKVGGEALAGLVALARAAETNLRALVRQFDTGTGTLGVFDVAQTVLELLGVVEGGQTASAKDTSVVSARFAPLLADLRARHIVDLVSVDGADVATKHFLAAILASRCAALFGVAEPMLTGLRAEAEQAETSLRSLSRQLDSGVGTGATLDAPQSVLEILGVVDAGQSASDKDRAVVTQRLASIYADLKNREIITVTSFAAADTSVQPHLIAIIAARLAPQFGLDPARLQVLNGEALRAEDALRTISRQLDTGSATDGTFDLIQVVLENLGAVAVGRTATSKDRAIISGRVTAVLDDLRQREVIAIPSLAAANASTLLQLSIILTSACAMAWGIPADVRKGLRDEAEQAETALRAQARQLDVGTGTGASFDLPQAVLEALRVIDAGQTASAKDRAVVSQRVAPVLADLRAREIIDIASLATAPDAAKVALATVVTAACAPSFGVDAAARTVFEAAATAAEADLRAMARQFDTGSATSGTYDLTQAVLEMLGVVGGGQTATANDRSVVAARIPLVLADLRQREIINLASLAAADSATLLHVAVLVAHRCAGLFPTVGEAMLATLKVERAEAEGALRRIARQLDTGAATGGTYSTLQAVLERLGVVEAGQTASAKDLSVISARVAPVLADLRAREVIDLPDLATAPAGTLGHLTTILAAVCADSFPVEAATVVRLAAERGVAEDALNAMARQFDTGAATSGTFDLVQSALEMLGVVAAGQTGTAKDRAVLSARLPVLLADLRDRDVIAIASADAAPAATRLHLAVLLATRCARHFGLAGDALAGLKDEAAGAEMALRRIARQVDAGSASGAGYDTVQAVLERLDIVAAGQTATAADRNAVSNRVAPLLADLRLREVIDLPSLTAADAGTLLQITTLLAAACAEAFGASPEKRAILAAQVPEAEAALNRAARQLDAGSATSGLFDVIQSALERLGVVAPGQTASAKDRAVISARVASTLADLRAREIIALTNLASAPDATQVHLAAILASVCAEGFPLPTEHITRLAADRVASEAALRTMARQFDGGAGTAGLFDVPQIVLETLGVVSAGQSATDKDRAVITGRYAALLGSLRRREIIDLASVASADDGTLPHLAAILSAWCAPQFGLDAARVAVLKAEAVAAEGELRRISRQLDAGAGTSGTFDAVQSALETLNVVEPGQTATAKDRAVVSARVAPMLADLKRRDIIDIASLAVADAGVQYHLASILAAWCAVSFKVAGDALVAIRTAATEAEAALRLVGRQLDGGVATGGTFDVVQAVLENLGVVAAGYTGSAKDRAVVSARVAPTLSDLRLREIVDIASIEAADPGTLIHLAVILTSACAQAFGKTAEVRALLAAEAVKAESSLKALARQLDSGVAVSGSFDPVQIVLEQIGIVSAGQTASAADRAVVEARVQPKLLELAGRDICGVTDLSLLSTELQGAFTRLLAADCALSFSEADPRRVAMLQAMVPEAERILRYQSFVYDARQPLRLEPFWGRRHCGYVV